MQVKSFTFGPFQENTYILYDETKNCVIVDPGCFTVSEEQELKSFIESNNLKVVDLLNTHCHLDHIAGNAFVFDTYGLSPVMHKDDLPVLENQQRSCDMYGIPCTPSPKPLRFIEEGDYVGFGNTKLLVIHVPGHAPGHVVFFHEELKVLINGDVLFQRSIGRTDLPLGNHDQLISSIKTKVFVLPDETLVYCGHGPTTTIGEEKIHNPYLR
jgi:hydroxyacylglutathione hydrolase